MKRRFLAVLLLGMTNLCAFAQTVTLDAAIASAAGEIAGRLDKGSRIAVLNISSSSKAMAEHIIDALSSALINDGRLEVVERDQEKLNFARQELDFNDSDEVSPKSAQQIGRMLAAKSIVSGSMKTAGSRYSLTIEVLEVETSVKKYSKSFSIQNDQGVRILMADTGAPLVEDYTTGERVGAAAFNMVFGIGSFRMKDKFGGGVTAVTEGAGIVMLIIGIPTVLRASAGQRAYKNFEDDHNYSSEITLGTALSIGGGVLYVGGLIFGIVRAATFHKPGYIAAGFDPLNIGLVADSKGNPALQFRYTFKF